MRYRALDANGDYAFGGNMPFLVDSPQAVAQAIKTRMFLFAGEWFLDLREGLDKQRILGYGTFATRDREIQKRILRTQGVKKILTYTSSVDDKRNFRVDASVSTIYGVVTISEIM